MISTSGGDSAAAISGYRDLLALQLSSTVADSARLYMGSLLRSRGLYAEALQVYRDQYRMSRAFILPWAVLGLILPFWAPIGALDGVGGDIGPLPIIRTQAFLVSVLASAVCYMAFRERAFRYAAAKALAWVTLEGVEQRDREYDDD